MRPSLNAGGTPSIIAGTLQRFSRWRNYRQGIRSLSSLPDDLLRDIGLTRGAIDDAVRHGRR
ncbi:MAG TPA: DUF1127 domain-containing protein [Bauldia sp.]|nr:DUF1127 domain-containing protein [Bauldia sp.]